MVGGTEDVVAHQAEGEDGPGVRGGELDWVVDQVKTLKQRKEGKVKYFRRKERLNT